MRTIDPASKIVIVIPTKLQTKSTIQVVEKNEPEIGEVIAVGKAGYFDNGESRPYPLDLKVGDVIAYRRFGESKFYIDGKLTIFVNQEDILAVIK